MPADDEVVARPQRFGYSAEVGVRLGRDRHGASLFAFGCLLSLRLAVGHDIGVGRHVAVGRSRHLVARRVALEGRSDSLRHDSFRAMSERIRPDAFWNAAATSS